MPFINFIPYEIQFLAPKRKGMITDVQAICIVAAAFIVAYFAGSVRNKKLMRKYALALREHLSRRCERVGFRAFGTSGFRALALPREGESFSKIEIAVALVDRENLLHYPLSLLTKDYDRLVCWCFPRGDVPLDVEIVRKSDRRLLEKAMQRRLKEIPIPSSELRDFAFFVSDPSLAERLFSDRKLRECLVGAKPFLRRLSFDRRKRYVHVTGELCEASVPRILDLSIRCCASVSRRAE